MRSFEARPVEARGNDDPIAAWLQSPQRAHSIGARFLGPIDCFETFTPARAYDALLYLEHVSPLHRLTAAH